MTGPEHYRAAEVLLHDLRNRQEVVVQDHIDNQLAKAQVHATLAFAASLGLSANLPMPDQHEWQQVAGSAFTS